MLSEEGKIERRQIASTFESTPLANALSRHSSGRDYDKVLLSLISCM
jgi:hypothetical protein